MLAERFHMDIDLFKQLNQGDRVQAGETISLPTSRVPGRRKGGPHRADKANASLRASTPTAKLIAAYPRHDRQRADPSPSGTHKVNAVAH
jgi:hypothetical protein